MSKFEFLMMIASVVVAVGMTEIIGGWGKMARTSAVIRFDWLHFGWSLYILLFAIQYWIGMWSYNQLEVTYVGQIYFVVVPTIFIVLAAYVVTPDVPLEGEFVVRDYYWRERAGMFISLAAFSISAWIADLVIVGVDRLEVDFMVLSIVNAASVLLLLATKRVWVHWLVLLVSLGFVLANFMIPMAYQDNRWVSP